MLVVGEYDCCFLPQLTQLLQSTQTNTPMPSRNEIIEMVAQNMYSGRIINNAHRGDIVEMMVLSALGNDWNLVGLGWHPWDKLSESVGIAIKNIKLKDNGRLVDNDNGNS